MSSDLIPIYPQPIGTKTLPAVSARDLHEKLGIKRDFMTWLQQHTTKGDWRKDHDFSVFHLGVENSHGGRPAMDAALSIQMAEHIAMMTRTPKGREIREYFRQARDERDAGLPASRGDLLVQMAEAYRAQEQRLLAIEAVQQDNQRQYMEQQAALIASQQQALEALQSATHAETKADLALADAHRMTLEEFVLKNGLVRQFPPPSFPTYTAWLKRFCRDYALTIIPAPVVGKPWDHENAYPLAALGAWLRYETTKPQQVTLVR